MQKLVDRFPIHGMGLHDINPVRAGYQKCSPDYYFGPVTRDSWTLQYVLSGRGTVVKNGKAFSVASACVFVLRPGETIELKADIIDPWTYIWIGFQTFIAMPDILNQQDLFQAEKLESLFLSIANCNTTKSHSLEFLLISKIWDLLFQLRNLEEKGLHSTRRELYIDRACALIESEYATITVSELADRLALDRSYFSKLFKRFSYISPQEYIITKRLQKSKELLIMGHSVSQVASFMGYSSLASFSRAFKEFYKYSPKQYLDQCIKTVR